MTAEKVRENRLRRMAQRQGRIVLKSRRRDHRALDYGRYWLHDDRNRILCGGSNGTSLDEIVASLTRNGEK